MYYVYVLRNDSIEGHELYIGSASNLKRRLYQHKNRKFAKSYTSKGDWKLVYYEAYLCRKDALAREKKLKYDGRGRYQLIKRLEYSIPSKG